MHNDFLGISKMAAEIRKKYVEHMNFQNQASKIFIEMGEHYKKIIRESTKIRFDFEKYFDFSEFTETFEKLRKGLIETEKDLQLFKLIIVELGYPPHEDMSISTIREIAQEYRENKDSLIEHIDDIMCAYYDSEEIMDITKVWERKPLLNKRLPILRNAIMAHNQGMYNVSIPPLFAQLEGLIVDGFDIKGRVDGKILGILLKELLEQALEGTYSFNKEIEAFYNKNISVNFEHGKNIESKVSRHAILHGGDISYGTQSNSIKVILLFDYIQDKLSELDNGVRQSGKKKVAEHRRRVQQSKRK